MHAERNRKVVTRPEDLAALVRRLADHGCFALDMEFHRERTYRARLQLVQVALPDETAAVDPLALPDLDPLFDLITDPSVQKVTHAGRQDAEIVYALTGKAPRNLYDTQIAAALLGYGGQIGYGSLVQRLLGVRLGKKERVTDWGRRPLSPEQLDYALDDVRYLPAVRDRLEGELRERKRRDWLREELAFYEDPATYRYSPEELVHRVPRWRSLGRRSLAVLRELVVWREREAERRDLPRQWIVPDDVLLEIALRKPNGPEDLRPLRRLQAGTLKRSGKDILAAVRRGLALPEAELPESGKPARPEPGNGPAVDLMAVILHQRAKEARVAASYLAKQSDLGALLAWFTDGRDDDAPALLRGWRRRLVGNDLLALLEGRVSLRIDPRSGAVDTLRDGDGRRTENAVPGDSGREAGHAASDRDPETPQ